MPYTQLWLSRGKRRVRPQLPSRQRVLFGPSAGVLQRLGEKAEHCDVPLVVGIIRAISPDEAHGFLSEHHRSSTQASRRGGLPRPEHL